MLKQPRSATVVCSPETPAEGGGGGQEEGKKTGGGCCVLNEIKGEDFMRMLKQSENFLRSMKVILRTRMFRSVIDSIIYSNTEVPFKFLFSYS